MFPSPPTSTSSRNPPHNSQRGHIQSDPRPRLQLTFVQLSTKKVFLLEPRSRTTPGCFCSGYPSLSDTQEETEAAELRASTTSLSPSFLETL